MREVRAAMSVDKYIADCWEEEMEGCDFAETNWRQYGFAWYKLGVQLGMTIGQKQGQESGDIKWRMQIPSTFGIGYRQGLSYAAFQASHLSIDNADLLGLNTVEGANLMRERIVAMLQAAQEAEAARLNAKVEPIT